MLGVRAADRCERAGAETKWTIVSIITCECSPTLRIPCWLFCVLQVQQQVGCRRPILRAGQRYSSLRKRLAVAVQRHDDGFRPANHYRHYRQKGQGGTTAQESRLGKPRSLLVSSRPFCIIRRWRF